MRRRRFLQSTLAGAALAFANARAPNLAFGAAPSSARFRNVLDRLLGVAR